jgi:histidinol-phosphate phosphatase family protein
LSGQAKKKPTQAVILAGGRGTRLAPLTNEIPKPMIEFHGKPFLEYIIVILRDQGIRRFLILLGYLPDKVTNYFGNGRKWSVVIDYNITAEENDTAQRLLCVKDKVDDYFLLTYCDNIWPANLSNMWQEFCSAFPSSDSDRPVAQVTVYKNYDNYTKNNLKIGDKNFVKTYDKSRKEIGLSGVDIGFLILSKSVLKLIGDDDLSFESSIYPQLVAQQSLYAYQTEHRYYSVGSHDRLHLTQQYLSTQKTVLLDRDGVLNKKMPQGEYVKSWSDWKWEVGAKEALCGLKLNGYRVIIITNQAGVGRGIMTENSLSSIHKEMRMELEQSGGSVDAIYYCPHHWDDYCNCRKPEPGLIFQAQKDFSINLSNTFFIGDDETDASTAKNAECLFSLVRKGRSLNSIVSDLIGNQLVPDIIGSVIH